MFGGIEHAGLVATVRKSESFKDAGNRPTSKAGHASTVASKKLKVCVGKGGQGG